MNGKELRPTLQFDPDGETCALARKVTDNWLLGIAETNPAILGMFRDRDVRPCRDLLPWSGEFAGKYLTSAHAVYRLTGDGRLREYVLGFIGDLLACQDGDGYLGCYSRACRLTGASSQNPGAPGATWDAWSHYHVMYGLYLWYGVTGDRRMLDAVLRAADLFLNTFYNGRPRLVSIGSAEMNLAPLHIFAMLYGETGERKYLDFALEIEKDLEDEAAGDYIRHSLNGLEFYQCPKPRWESLHVVMGILEMHRCTGEARYLSVAKQIFYSILETDVHNTGAFSTDEMAIGHPYKNGAVETCCVVAYNALACAILEETGDNRVADFLELSHCNAVMGAFSPTGRWSTYDTPMEGTRCASFHSIGFQCRPGSPELNCCSVNAPRGLGMLHRWAVAEKDGVLRVNAFEPMRVTALSGLEMEITGAYPADGRVRIRLRSREACRVAVRIPAWSARTQAALNGVPLAAAAGQYLELEREWQDDVLDIAFDFGVRMQDGDRDCKGKKSVYCGPVLYGFDASLNPHIDIDAMPAIPAGDLARAAPSPQRDGGMLLKLDCGVTLSDFRSLGRNGSRYTTWLPVSAQ